MVEIGNYNELELVKFVDFGAYLDSEDGEILLPLKWVPENAQIGDKLNVFIYRDSEDRIIATTMRPKATVNQFATLEAKDVTRLGAFMDWGLEKDLLVPLNNQREPMQAGKKYVVYIYLDDSSDRIVGTTKDAKYLQEPDEKLQEGQKVNLIVTNLTDLGYNVIIDNKYNGVLYHNEVFRALENGEETAGYIKKIRDDKKIDVSLQQTGFAEVQDAAGTVLQKLQQAGGRLELSDSSDPKDIYDALGMSKKTFKKAIGTLFRAGKITLQPTFIQLTSGEE
jgi:predicted RNA-binding protein (virulence factor B family)